MERLEEFFHDPTKASEVFDDTPLIDTGKIVSYMHVMEDRFGRKLYGGEFFKNGSDQMLVSKILKGIVPVADVVCEKNSDGRTYFYSYEMPIERVSGSNDNKYIPFLNTKEAKKLQADISILKQIFMDGDHGWGTNEVFGSLRQYYFFDFAHVADFWRKKELYLHFSPKSIREELTRFAASPDCEILDFLNERLYQLLERLRGESGLELLKAILEYIHKKGATNPVIIENAPGDDFKDKLKGFHRELLMRIRVMYKISSEVIDEKDPLPQDVLDQNIPPESILEPLDVWIPPDILKPGDAR